MKKHMYFNVEIWRYQSRLDWYDDNYKWPGRTKPAIVPVKDYGILMVEKNYGKYTSEWAIWIDGETEFIGHIVPLEADPEFNENDKGMLAEIPDKIGPFTTEDEAYKKTVEVAYNITSSIAFNHVK